MPSNSGGVSRATPGNKGGVSRAKPGNIGALTWATRAYCPELLFWKPKHALTLSENFETYPGCTTTYPITAQLENSKTKVGTEPVNSLWGNDSVASFLRLPSFHAISLNLAQEKKERKNQVHGEPTIKFNMDEVVESKREEGLHQAIDIKFSYGHPDLNDIHSLIPKQLGIKGNCLVGKALLSITSAVGKLLAIKKETQIRSRPGTARVKVLVDLLDKHAKRRYEMSFCHLKSKSDVQEGLVQPSVESNNVEQLKGDARAYLNAKRAGNKNDEVSSTKEVASTNSNDGKKLFATDDGEVAENSELCKANLVGQGNDEQLRLNK
ncbi:hypothetical protein FXO38_12799 [Capsicum annuum]|nr:hypothetical protein FXO38_12799 [Capsicum annuum]